MNIQDLIRIRQELKKQVEPPMVPALIKDGFPIPSPEKGEDEQVYISRCVSSIIDEYGDSQSAAICYAQWEKK
jgi:hypothetical protein